MIERFKHVLIGALISALGLGLVCFGLGHVRAQITNPVPIAGSSSPTFIGQQQTGIDGTSNNNLISTLPGFQGILSSGNFIFNGSSWDRLIVCTHTSTFSVASTTSQVIALSSGQSIRICSFDINPATITAGSTDIVYGTGVNCVTGLTTLTGAYTLPAAAVVDITPSTLSALSPLTVPASQAVCIRAVTSTVNGFIVWEQH